MSRTFRRKQGHGWSYGHRSIKEDVLTDSDWIRHEDNKFYWYERVERFIDPKSKEGKKLIAKFHADSDYHRNRKGKGWWRNYFVQRPYRRDAEQQIRMMLLDDEFEHTILDKPKMPWWD